MLKLSIHEAAEQKAIKAAAHIANDKLMRSAKQAAYKLAVSGMAQEVERGTRTAWASRSIDEVPVSANHPLLVQLLDWLKNGQRTEETTHGGQYNQFTRERASLWLAKKAINEEWITSLYISNDADAKIEQYGNGAVFDQIETFTNGVASAENEKLEGRRARQIDAILTAAAALEYDAVAIPDGGKAAIKRICLRRTDIFTDSGFDHAWAAASKAGKVCMANKDKFVAGGGQ